MCEQGTWRTQAEGNGPAPRPTPTANSEGAAGRLCPPFFDVKVSGQRDRGDSAHLVKPTPPPHTQRRSLVIFGEREGPFGLPPLSLWRRVRVINHLIDWLSSYPKHDLKNKIKFAIYHLCQNTFIKEKAAL